MYSKQPNYILGFHGCHRDVFETVLNPYGDAALTPSTNDYDWLGNGIYFWEFGLDRARRWARAKHGEDGMVIGAILDLGRCLNLSDTGSTELLQHGVDELRRTCEEAGVDMPTNQPLNDEPDRILRRLDCAIIEAVHKLNDEDMTRPPFDTVRGVFVEGEPICDGSEIFTKTHVQIAVRNPNCIKGYFKPLDRDNTYPLP